MKWRKLSQLLAFFIISTSGCRSIRSHQASGNDLSGTRVQGPAVGTLAERLKSLGQTSSVIEVGLDGGTGPGVIAEAKISSLVPASTSIKYEASGIAFDGARLYVAMDNQLDALIAVPVRVTKDSARLEIPGTLVGRSDFAADSAAGFEGITYIRDGNPPIFYLLQESKWKKETFDDPTNPIASSKKAGLSRYQLSQGSIEHRGFHYNLLLPQEFESENKGYEGIANLQANGKIFLFTLCEGNFCKKQDSDLHAFNGTIRIYQEGTTEDWDVVQDINLGDEVPFLDFSDLDIGWKTITADAAGIQAQGRILITSQIDSAIWSAEIRVSITDQMVDVDVADTKFYHLGSEKGYCNLEGITWIDVQSGLIALASDAAKKSDVNGACGQKDQSIHLLKI